MASSKTVKQLYIDPEALSVLNLVKCGLLYPVTGLMNSAQSLEVLQTGTFNQQTFPFPFLLAPSGRRNHEVLTQSHPGDTLELICEQQSVGSITVEEIFEIDIHERLQHIYGTDDIAHPGVASTLSRLGKVAVSGPYEIYKDTLEESKNQIFEAKERINARHVTAMMMAANPLHRAHERLIRQTLDSTDLIIIFLLKPYATGGIPFSLRKESLEYFIENFLPTNRVEVVTLEHSYIFAGYNEVIIDAIVAKNFGCNRLTIGQNHAGVGMYYDQNTHKSVIDRLYGIDIEIAIANEYVYCNICKTLVSTHTCPHGQHHHINYHSNTILELMDTGIVPPAVLIRKEISSLLLSNMYPERFKNLEKLYYDILPVNGLLEEHSEKDFYMELMKLYQTTSLT